MAVRIKMVIETDAQEAAGTNTYKIIKEMANEIHATWQAESSYFEDSVALEFRAVEKEYAHEIEMTIKSENYALLIKIASFLTGIHAHISRFVKNI
jgi:hypothetical protein